MHRRSTPIGLSVILMIAAAFTAATQRARSQSTSGQAAASGAKKAEEQFKNIQVLKGIPADQVIPTMQFIGASLGVECSFCHVENAFEKDDKKPKQAARKMIEMMFSINADNFDRQRAVTCYSCHRGHIKPMAIPAVMEGTNEAGPPHGPEPGADEAKQNAGPSGDEILAKYVQSLGGAAAVEKITSRVMKGTIEFGGKSFPIDIYSKAPDKRISLTHLPEGDSVTAFNGHEGWLSMPGRPLREMHGGDLIGAAIDADLHLATDFPKMFGTTDVRQGEKIEGREVFHLVGQSEGKPPMNLYFDVDSGLLVRMVRYGDTALGLMPTQVDYADYRPADGVKVPYRWTLARPSGRFTVQVTELQQNVPVDEARFQKPPAPPEKPEKGHSAITPPATPGRIQAGNLSPGGSAR
jgi:photosynthetic reaction center cytochrome c subunit